MKNNKILFGLFLILFSVAITTAQKQPWTLQTCIDTGVQRNITLQQGQVANKINAVNLTQAKNNLYPSVNITDEPGENFGKTQNLTGGYIPLNTTTNAFGINGNVTLYSGSQLQNTIRQNNFIYQAGIQSVETTKNNLSLNILTDYMQVLADYEGVDIAESQIKSDSTQAEIVRIEVNVGKSGFPELSLLQVESQLASDKLAKVNAKNTLLLAKVNLMQLMNMPVDYGFNILRPVNVDSLLAITAQTSGDIYNTAARFLPQVKNAELSTQANESGLKVAKGLYYPKLSLSGNIKSSASSLTYYEYYQAATIGYVEGNPGFPVEGYEEAESYTNNTTNLWNQFNDNFNQFIGLNLTVPIFTNFIARNSVQIAKLNVQNAKLNEDQIKITLRQTIEQAYTYLLAAAEQYAASKDALVSEARSFSDMQKKFKIGLETATDYLVEESNYTKARQNVAQAKYNYLLQVKLVDFYLGKPITF